MCFERDCFTKWGQVYPSFFITDAIFLIHVYSFSVISYVFVFSLEPLLRISFLLLDFFTFLLSIYFCVRHYCYVVCIILSCFFTFSGGSYSACLCFTFCIAVFSFDFQSLRLCSLSYFWSLPSGVCLWVETGLFPQLITCLSKCKTEISSM